MAADFRYEQEQMAWGLLEQNKAVRFVVDSYLEVSNDLNSFAALKGRNLLVTEASEPRVHRLYCLAAERIGVTKRVPVYLEMEYNLQARTVGTDDSCAIVISSACVELLSDAQLLAMLGHELAHIHYGHIRMLHIHEMTDTLLNLIPMAGKAAAEGFKATLLNWRKCADFTADRGAAIAAGSADAAMQNLCQSMGRSMDSLGIRETLNQLPAEKELKFGTVGTAVFQVMTGSIRVPYGVWRMKELKKWSASVTCRECFPTVYYGTASEFGLDSNQDGALLFRQYQTSKDKESKMALALLHTAAGRGNGSAQAELGRRYLEADGVSANIREAMHQIRSAALSSAPEGWYLLANCFAQGYEGVLDRDEKRAVWLYRLAAAAGHGSAAKKVPASVNTISAKSMTALLAWLTANFTNGPAVLNEQNPGAGLNEACCPEIRAIRRYLWIPGNETVYLVETAKNRDGTLRSSIAVASAGIYTFTGKGLPVFFSWAQWMHARVDALQNDTRVTLRVDGVPLCSYNTPASERTVGVLLVKLRSAMGQKKG